MRIYNKNTVTDKEFRMFLLYTKQDSKVYQTISDIIIVNMINYFQRRQLTLQLIYLNEWA